MAFIQLPAGEVKNKKERKIKSGSFPRKQNVNVLFPQLQHIAWCDKSEFQQKLIEALNKEEDFRKYL